jgi:poly-gamma-glutamate capsule biosynthesis protein CapA/YwtB (metallophosphatase superfamily)
MAAGRSMAGPTTIFLCGDVMTGRGIDQVLPHPGKPVIYEPYMKSARGYVDLAEKATGPFPRSVDFAYIWGDARDELGKVAPAVRIINLETAITDSDDWLDKGINYRMNPANIPCLEAAAIDCCCLANNHILDWGYQGLIDTVDNLDRAHIQHAGAGRDLQEAHSPAFLDVRAGARVIIFSFGDATSGIPSSWAAMRDKPGVNFLEGLTSDVVHRIGERIKQVRRTGDIVVASVHWGRNWDFSIPPKHREFAHGLVDEAGVDLIYGHSSHHVKGVEVYREKLILYGCGDFLNDYEGIYGHEEFRGDLGLMYFARIDPSTGALLSLQMTPTQIRHFRVVRPSVADARWLAEIMNREARKLGTGVELDVGDRLTLRF